jgi:hypothetical protein
MSTAAADPPTHPTTPLPAMPQEALALVASLKRKAEELEKERDEALGKKKQRLR